MVQVTIYLTQPLLDSVDSFRKKQEFIPSRSGVIVKALDEYFKIHCGIPYMIARRGKVKLE
jgi:metal-responsive CopG/Arc/MetJ family transcriptional regulator